MGVILYYIDGHTSIVDANNVWTNDANAFDGNSTDDATNSTAGSTNTLIGTGSNAPSTDDTTVTQVRARMYWGRESDVTATVGSYSILTAPTGGWSWQKVNSLRANCHWNSTNGPGAIDVQDDTLTTLATLNASISSATVFQVYKVELEITTIAIMESHMYFSQGFQ